MFLLSLLMVASASVAPNATVSKSLKNATANGVSVKVSIQCWDAQGRDSRCMTHNTATGTFDDMPSQLCLPLGVRQDSVVLVWQGSIVTTAGWCFSSQTTIDTADNLFLRFSGYRNGNDPGACDYWKPLLANGDCTSDDQSPMGDFRYQICYQGLC
eukprot:Hpha_TRINITY_DN16741_c1_g1::TRINITY_DN16741_c1_g1_i6::g.78327::m.78327